jgi:hypothetical protein
MNFHFIICINEHSLMNYFMSVELNDDGLTLFIMDEN